MQANANQSYKFSRRVKCERYGFSIKTALFTLFTQQDSVTQAYVLSLSSCVPELQLLMTASEEDQSPFCVDSVSICLSGQGLLGGGASGFLTSVAMALDLKAFSTLASDCFSIDDNHHFSRFEVHRFLPDCVSDSSDIEGADDEDCSSLDFSFKKRELYFFPSHPDEQLVCIQQNTHDLDPAAGSFEHFVVLPSVDLLFYFCSDLSSSDALAYLEPYYGFSTFFQKLFLGQLICSFHLVDDVWGFHLIHVFYALFPDPTGTVDVRLCF